MIAKIKVLLKKHREIVSFGFWGGITSIINIGVFQILYLISAEYRISNIIALTITIIIAYIVNKKFVFRSRCANTKKLIGEIVRYVITRGFTMLIDYFGLILLTADLLINPQIGKFITTVIVVIINYALGKFHVYK